jgi:hypothetical protein
MGFFGNITPHWFHSSIPEVIRIKVIPAPPPFGFHPETQPGPLLARLTNIFSHSKVHLSTAG